MSTTESERVTVAVQYGHTTVRHIAWRGSTPPHCGQFKDWKSTRVLESFLKLLYFRNAKLPTSGFCANHLHDGCQLFATKALCRCALQHLRNDGRQRRIQASFTHCVVNAARGID